MLQYLETGLQEISGVDDNSFSTSAFSDLSFEMFLLAVFNAIMYWAGVDWQQGTLKVWDGVQWAQKVLKRFNGVTWI